VHKHLQNMKIDLNMYETNRTVYMYVYIDEYLLSKNKRSVYRVLVLKRRKPKRPHQKAENINGRIECANNSELNICYVFFQNNI